MQFLYQDESHRHEVFEESHQFLYHARDRSNLSNAKVPIFKHIIESLF